MQNLAEEIISGLDAKLGRLEAREAGQAKRDFQFFSEHIKERKDKEFHKRMRHMLATEKRGVILFPRGFAKSTIGCVDFPEWEIAKNRDVRIIVATNAQRLGVEWLREIENDMLNNALYRDYFGNMVPEARTLTWTDTEKIVLGRSSKATHTTLYTLSTTGSTLGKRGDIILADDIYEPEAGIPSEAQLNRTREWFWKILYPVLEPLGKCFVMGTRFHPMDLYGELIDAGWPYIIQPALDENDRSTWEERMPTDELLRRRHDQGSIIFNLQYQNNANISLGLAMDFLHFVEEHEVPDDLSIYMGVDPSLVPSAGSDYLCIAIVGTNRAGNAGYLLDLIRTKGTLDQQVEIIIQTAKRWKPKVIALETNAAQILIKHYLQKVSLLPVRGVPSVSNKMSRFVNMSAVFEAGRVMIKGIRDQGKIVPLHHLQPFIEEWVAFPHGKHDDTLDAVEKALTVAIYDDMEPAEAYFEPNDDPGSPFRRPSVMMFHDRGGYGGRLFDRPLVAEPDKRRSKQGNRSKVRVS